MSEADVRNYAAERRFSAASVDRWLAEPAADRDALLALAQRLRLSENQFRDFFDDAVDLAARDGSSVAAVLERADVRGVWERQLGRNEAIKAVKATLRRLRYPQLTAVEQRLAVLAKDLRLPAGVRVEFPANLEGEHVTVRLHAASATELRAQAEALATALRGDEVDQLFALLEGHW